MILTRPQPRAALYFLAATLSLSLGGPAGAQATVRTPAPAAQPTTRALPARLTDAEFWKLVTDFSEPDGFFRSDNLVSNEVTFQYVIPELKKVARTGGVYLGVGPDQNFTYLVALQPKIAFIFDIRRQNMLMHLMYKSLIEQSPTRADFLSKLFARAKPPALDVDATAGEMFAAFRRVPSDSLYYYRTVAAMKTNLITAHKFTLSPDDIAAIEWVYYQFYLSGPDLTYSSGGGGGGARPMPTYSELQIETDADGLSRGYLANEANYRTLRELELKNLIVPVVGDFGGPKAIRAVGQYLREHNATATAFYTSNVEQYLFQSGAWQRFFANVGTLPLDSNSTFIRAVFNYMNIRSTATSGARVRSVTMLQPMADAVRAFNEGRIQQYYDVIMMSR
jgi:hypothetical protein